MPPLPSSAELPAFLARRFHAAVEIGGQIVQADTLGAARAAVHSDQRQVDIAGRDFPHQIFCCQVREIIPGDEFDRDHGSGAILRHEEEGGVHRHIL